MKSTKPNAGAFTKTAPFYDVVYSGRDTHRDIQLIANHIHRLLPRKKHLSVLDMGCGTGTHALELWQRGFAVSGVDRSAAMISIARKKTKAAGASIDFVVHNLLTYEPPIQFDAAISLFDVLSYMTTAKQIELFFNAASAALRPGGVFVFDCWYGPTVLLSPPQVIQRRHRNADVFLWRKKTPTISYDTNTVTVLHDLKVSQKKNRPIHVQEKHTLRYFFYPEIELAVERAGFTIVTWGVLDSPMQTPTPSSWSVCFVIQKNHLL